MFQTIFVNSWRMRYIVNLALHDEILDSFEFLIEGNVQALLKVPTRDLTKSVDNRNWQLRIAKAALMMDGNRISAAVRD